jgi:hypothetical protein
MPAFRLPERHHYARRATRHNLMSQAQGVRDVSDPPGRGAGREAGGGGGALTSAGSITTTALGAAQTATRETPNQLAMMNKFNRAF